MHVMAEEPTNLRMKQVRRSQTYLFSSSEMHRTLPIPIPDSTRKEPMEKYKFVSLGVTANRMSLFLL